MSVYDPDKRAAFEQAISADLADDTTRLVYADWLEENPVSCPYCHGDGKTIGSDGLGTCSGCNGSGSRVLDAACDMRCAVALRAILANPDDDAPRLYYAAICENYGRKERAEFIRVQCELAKNPVHQSRQTRKAGVFRIEIAEREKLLNQRERELLDANTHIWLFDLPPGFRPLLPDDIRNTFRRGFADRVMCTAAEWLQHADTFCTAAPICRVRLTTCDDWDSFLINGEFSVLHKDGQSIWTSPRYPGITFELPPASAADIHNRVISVDELLDMHGLRRPRRRRANATPHD